MALEGLSEITGASETASVADRCDGQISLGQHLTGDLQTVAAYIGIWNHMKAISENTIAFPLAQKGGSRQLRYRYLIRIVFMNVDHHLFDLIFHRITCGPSFVKWPG